MKPLLKMVYLAHRKTFHEFFIEEYIGEIPEKIQEPSMTFLANGREKLERWCMFMAYLIQKKITEHPDEIKEHAGMLKMLRLFKALVVQKNVGQTRVVGEPTAHKPDPSKEVDAAVAGLKERFKS